MKIQGEINLKFLREFDKRSLVQPMLCHLSMTATPFASRVSFARAVLKESSRLWENAKERCSPNNLTLLFGGGPGDYDKRGLNHLAQMPPDGTSSPPMLRRTIGSHYGQTPMVAKLALDEVIEAWTLPMGSVSRMLRSQSTHSPGHITNIGIGTYEVDPRYIWWGSE
jgi:propionate CoA-transferase